MVNIPGSDVNAGDTLVDYVGSGPPVGSGLHRYIFLVFKQAERQVFNEPIKYDFITKSCFTFLHKSLLAVTEVASVSTLGLLLKNTSWAVHMPATCFRLKMKINLLSKLIMFNKIILLYSVAIIAMINSR